MSTQNKKRLNDSTNEVEIFTEFDKQRFEEKLTPEPNTGCWLWTACTLHGHGRFFWRGRTWFAHRIAYKLRKGPIPKGLVIDHLCRQPSCVNPDHLEAVSNKTNILRGEGLPAKRARQTHCKNGHALSGDNLRPTTKQRVCKECDNTWRRKRNALKNERAQ